MTGPSGSQKTNAAGIRKPPIPTRPKEAATQITTKTLTKAQIEAIESSKAELQEAAKSSGGLGGVLKLLPLALIAYAAYSGYKSGAITQVLDNLNQKITSVPAIQKIAEHIPGFGGKGLKAAPVLEDGENKNAKQVVQNFNNKLVDYTKALDTIGDSEGDAKRQPAGSPSESAVRVDHNSNGILFPLKVGNKFAVLESGHGDSDRFFCKVSEVQDRIGSTANQGVFKVVCSPGGAQAGGVETYYLTRNPGF